MTIGSSFCPRRPNRRRPPPGPGQGPSSTRHQPPQYGGNVSWFLTVYPSPPARNVHRCAVVCYKRVLAHSRTTYTATCDNATGYGGIGISIGSNGPVTSDPPLKNDQWALYTTTTAVSGTTPQCTWYRVVNVGFDGTNTRVNLVGPDWNGDGTGTKPATLVIVGGVTGVYTTTVQLN